MSFLSGSSSFVRFSVEGELPDNPLEFISDRISSFVFEDIDDNFEEYSVGWVSVLNMFDSAFEYGSHLFGDYVVLSLRADERKVSPSILKKFTQKEEERIKKEKQVPKLSRTIRLEIKVIALFFLDQQKGAFAARGLFQGLFRAGPRPADSFYHGYPTRDRR